MTSETSSNDISLPASWKSKPALLVAVGAVCLLLSVGLSYLNAPSGAKAEGVKFFMHSYLTNYMYCLSFGLGALFFVLIQFLCRAGWSASIRRLAEIVSATIPWMGSLHSNFGYGPFYQEHFALRVEWRVCQQPSHRSQTRFPQRSILCRSNRCLFFGFHRLSEFRIPTFASPRRDR